MMNPRWDTILLCMMPATVLVLDGCKTGYAMALYFSLVIIVTAIREKK